MSTLRWWFVTAPCGDFRLEALDEGARCKLTVEDPTARDYAKLYPFLVALVERGLVTAVPVLKTTGVTELLLEAPMVELGPMLAEHAAPGAWTVVRHVKGTITVEPALADVEATAEAVASVQPPKKGCPAPTPAVRRAREVLRTFSTERQWATYMGRGYMRVIGNVSGRAYNVFHRDEAARRGLSRCVTVASTGEPVCAWDERVPPEEETLGLKIALEHREPWLLDAGRR